MLERLFSPVFLKRIRKFQTLKRGYYSFLILIFFYGLSFFNFLIINDSPLVLSFQGKYRFPAINEQARYLFSFFPDLNEVMGERAELYRPVVFNHPLPPQGWPWVRAWSKRQMIKAGRFIERRWNDVRRGMAMVVSPISSRVVSPPLQCKDLGIEGIGTNIDFRKLKESWKGSANWLILPPYPYHPNVSLLDLSGTPPHAPSRDHWLGTDDRGRDVFARLMYGFNISISFALMVTAICYAFGILVGACLGYYGGTFDIITQRFVEIWSAVPFLYAVMIVANITKPSFMMLVILLCLWGWIGITYYIRGEYLREKTKEYVLAAEAIGLSDFKIMFKHILPNALTPVISFIPFAIVGEIEALVSLDFLGFGLPSPTPSWGELLGQGMANLTKGWLVFSPLGALFITLLLITFIGEAVREAFDPRSFSRLH